MKSAGGGALELFRPVCDPNRGWKLEATTSSRDGQAAKNFRIEVCLTSI